MSRVVDVQYIGRFRPLAYEELVAAIASLEPELEVETIVDADGRVLSYSWKFKPRDPRADQLLERGGRPL